MRTVGVRASLPSIFASVALSVGLTLGGLHFFSRKKGIRGPMMILVFAGLMVLAATRVFANAAPPQPVLTAPAGDRIVIQRAESNDPSILQIPRGLLNLRPPPAGAGATVADGAQSSKFPSVFASVALSLGLMLGGLHVFRGQKTGQSPLVWLILAGSLAATAGASSCRCGSGSPPASRAQSAGDAQATFPTQPAAARLAHEFRSHPNRRRSFRN